MIEKNSQPIFRYLIMLTVCSVIGLQTWMILFNNFSVEVAGLTGQQVGAVQSVREIPGFLSLLAVYVMLLFAEPTIAALSVILLGAGLAATGLFPSYAGIMVTTLLMSTGFHYYATMNQSLVLQNFKKEITPMVFSRMRSLSAAAAIITAGLLFVLGKLLDYRWVYLILGGGVALVGVYGLLHKPLLVNAIPQRKKMIVRRRYSLYYFLTFMAGARRQIFVAFSVYLLVGVFSFSVQAVTILFILNNLINYFLNPLIGKAILTFGERRVLSVEYAGLIFVFLTYGFTDSKVVVVCMYILDHIFFNFTTAINTYFQKIADPKDIAPSAAVGFTINHIAAVFLPFLGGMVWMIDHRIPFIVGAVMSGISLMAVQKIRVPESGTESVQK
ncbi:MFS transporter [Desulfobulbus rhabdoformis]|uniref:MFS transporter n=1 Tax=Desulfobulbus rhabdoformis TaxID=34032 RepID=UPI003083FC12